METERQLLLAFPEMERQSRLDVAHVFVASDPISGQLVACPAHRRCYQSTLSGVDMGT